MESVDQLRCEDHSVDDEEDAVGLGVLELTEGCEDLGISLA